jgi:hypothetical protein
MGRRLKSESSTEGDVTKVGARDNNWCGDAGNGVAVTRFDGS